MCSRVHKHVCLVVENRFIELELNQIHRQFGQGTCTTRSSILFCILCIPEIGHSFKQRLGRFLAGNHSFKSINQRFRAPTAPDLILPVTVVSSCNLLTIVTSSLTHTQVSRNLDSTLTIG